MRQALKLSSRTPAAMVGSVRARADAARRAAPTAKPDALRMRPWVSPVKVSSANPKNMTRIAARAF